VGASAAKSRFIDKEHAVFGLLSLEKVAAGTGTNHAVTPADLKAQLLEQATQGFEVPVE
jgi:hypothetical protein